jgi:hypothetical protein
VSEQRCRECGRSIYFRGEKDEVGRATSTGRWVHYDHALDDEHQAVPR